MSVTRRRTWAIAQPTPSPIAIPPPASTRNSSTVWLADTLPPMAAATATL